MCRPRARRCGATVTRKWRERVQKVFEMNERRRSRHRSYPASFRAKPSFHESEGSDTRKNQSEFSTALTPGNLSRQKSPRLPQTGIVRKCAADAKERTRPALPPGRIQVPYSGASRGSPPLALARRVARARASLSAGVSESPEDVGGVEFPRRGGAHGEQRGRTRAGVGRAHGHAAQGVQVRRASPVFFPPRRAADEPRRWAHGEAAPAPTVSDPTDLPLHPLHAPGRRRAAAAGCASSEKTTSVSARRDPPTHPPRRRLAERRQIPSPFTRSASPPVNSVPLPGLN